jgi:hypothetical protein
MGTSRVQKDASVILTNNVLEMLNELQKADTKDSTAD